MGFNATIEDFKKLGLVEYPAGSGVYVKASAIEERQKPKAEPKPIKKKPKEDSLADIKFIHIYINGKTEYITPKYTFNIRPVPGLRMSSSDRWKTKDNPNPKYRQRPSVTRYFEFKTALKAECEKQGYELTDQINLLFMFKMPDSWSKKKRTAMINTPHKQLGDIDNLQKGFFDALSDQDKYIWDVRAIKIWSDRDAIIVF